MGDTKEFNLDEISLRSVCVDVVKNLWVIVLAAVAAWFAVTGVEKLIYVPEYTATATLAVSAKGSSSNAYTSLSMTSQMAGVFSEVFSSNVLRERIAEDMGVDSIQGEITTSIIEETNLITLQVTSENPRETYLIISSALDNYDTVSDYLFSNAVLRIVQEPSVPYSPSNVMNISRIRKLGMLGAAGGVGALLVLLSVLRFTVKTRQGAARNLDGRLLGTIPYEKKQFTWKEILQKKKKSLLISTSLVSMVFSESIRKLVTRLNHHMSRRKQKVILVTSVSENEGKSSVAANLALALAEKGKRVALIDGDLKKPAQYKVFGQPEAPKGWLSDYLSGKAGIGEVLVHDKSRSLYMIYQNSSVRNSGGLLESSQMKDLINACRKNMDYLVLDSSPMALASDAELMLKQVDLAVLVVRQDRANIRAINDAADVIRKSGVDFGGFVLNAFHRELSLQPQRGYGRYYGGAGRASEE